MKPIALLYEIRRAVKSGKRIIILRGGTRSGKTFAILMYLCYLIRLSPLKWIITVVSHSFPHLYGGAIRDFEKILESDGVVVELFRKQHPYQFTFRKSLLEFIGFDKPGKALGASRNILYINEANKMPFKICHQLIQRTSDLIFIDYNPANMFWVDEEGIINRDDAVVIDSSFEGNRTNLASGIIDDLMEAKRKHDEEEARDVHGYWWNWWRVYGLGLQGQIEGAIFTDWEIGAFDETLPFGYGMDFGVRDQDAIVRCAIDRKRKIIYAQEILYKNGLSTGMLEQEMIRIIPDKTKMIVADSAAPRTILDLKGRGFNISPVKKPMIIDRIKPMQEYRIIISPESSNLIQEIVDYVWLDKKGEIPVDEKNHLMDALGYYFVKIVKPATSWKGHKTLKRRR